MRLLVMKLQQILVSCSWNRFLSTINRVLIRYSVGGDVWQVSINTWCPNESQRSWWNLYSSGAYQQRHFRIASWHVYSCFQLGWARIVLSVFPTHFLSLRFIQNKTSVKWTQRFSKRLKNLMMKYVKLMNSYKLTHRNLENVAMVRIPVWSMHIQELVDYRSYLIKMYSCINFSCTFRLCSWDIDITRRKDGGHCSPRTRKGSNRSNTSWRSVPFSATVFLC